MAVRTEVSAQTGTADVTPLLTLSVFLLLRTAFPGQRLQAVIVAAIEAGVYNTSVLSLRSLRIKYLGRNKYHREGLLHAKLLTFYLDYLLMPLVEWGYEYAQVGERSGKTRAPKGQTACIRAGMR